MFLHIGGSRIVFYDEVIGIFNMNLIENPINKEFLETFSAEGYVNLKERKKSFIVTDKKIYFSPISSVTLEKRKESPSLQKNNVIIDLT